MGFGSIGGAIGSIAKPVAKVSKDITSGAATMGKSMGVDLGTFLGGEKGGKLGGFLGGAGGLAVGGLLGGGLGLGMLGSQKLKDFFKKTRPEDFKDLPIEEFGRTPGELEDITKSLAEERKKMMGLEEQARERLSESTIGYGRAIDERLRALSEDIGFQAGEATRTVGESFAGRGLGRSTFALEKLGEVKGAEISEKAGLREQASSLKREAEQRGRAVAQSIADRRVSMANRLRDLERQGLQSAEFQKEAANVQMEFQKFVANLDLDEQRGSGLISMVSNILK